jgi:hypothetical protein
VEAEKCGNHEKTLLPRWRTAMSRSHHDSAKMVQFEPARQDRPLA